MKFNYTRASACLAILMFIATCMILLSIIPGTKAQAESSGYIALQSGEVIEIPASDGVQALQPITFSETSYPAPNIFNSTLLRQSINLELTPAQVDEIFRAAIPGINDFRGDITYDKTPDGGIAITGLYASSFDIDIGKFNQVFEIIKPETSY